MRMEARSYRVLCAAGWIALLTAQVGAQIQTAGSLLVELNAKHASAGSDVWVNTASASIGDFLKIGTPFVEVIEEGTGVTFNAAGPGTDFYQCEADAPAGITGVDPTCSIEAWVYNPAIAVEETILAWGRRGGTPDGSNMSFNYGSSGGFGAVGHWGAADLGWNDAGGAPPAAQWHHVVYTFDGTTQRVYYDGCRVDLAACERNSEALAAGTLNTFSPSKITLAGQIEADGVTINGPLSGTLSIGRVRIHDGVLTAAQVKNNYDLECTEFCPPPGLVECPTCPGSDTHYKGKSLYQRKLVISGFPPPSSLTVTQPAGAAISPDGYLTYNVPNPAPASFPVQVKATNSQGTATFSWTVTLVDPPGHPGIHVAETLLVDLNANSASAGSFAWLNAGTLSDFFEIGDPEVADLGPNNAPGVGFNLGTTSDAYQCFEPAPDGIVGVDPTRTIEVWAYNPDIVDEETLLSWGHRGGPNGSNMSFNYGIHPLYGAVGHWGGDGPDLGWNNAGGAPEAGAWHHLVYTFDGDKTHTTRVYADGLLANSETLAPGTINTHTGLPITLGVQITDAAGTLEFGPLQGTLALGQVRVHDGVLTPTEIFENFEAERDVYGVAAPPNQAPTFVTAPEEDFYCPGDTTYTAFVQVTAVPPATLAAIAPAGATIDEAGRVSYTIPAAQPATFNVTIRATNSIGSTDATWPVTKINPSGAVESAGELFVDLNAQDPSAGNLTWTNNGSIGDFNAVGAPTIVEKAGVLAVSFNEEGRSGDSYESPEAAPEGLTGLDPTRTIEVWAFNEQIPVEETILSWGKRGGPDGSNASFNYGTNPLYGAFGHWGGNGPDIGWSDQGGAPAPGVWHHLVYTFDGSITRVYADGELSNSEQPAVDLNTYPEPLISLAQQHEADGLTFTTGLEGSLAIAQVRIHDGVLTPCQVLNNYLAERDTYGQAPFFTNAPTEDTFCQGQSTYTVQVQAAGQPPPTYSMLAPAGATVSPTGVISYTIPSPSPASFVVTVRASNTKGSVDATWTVTRETTSGTIEVAEELLVDLDANDPSAGDDAWSNAGSSGDFVRVGAPLRTKRGGVNAVSFNEDGRSGDSYESEEAAPLGVTGVDPTRTIEAWVWNPEPLGDEETILSWGNRGGPNGTNMSFNYGIHPLYGAVGHWGGDGPDIGWNNAGGAPAAGAWHHLVYTYDGETTRVYADGALMNSEFLGAGVINTYPNPRISLAQQHEADGAVFTTGLQGMLAIGRVRIHDGVLSDCQINNNYETEKNSYLPPPCPTPGQPDYADTHAQSLVVTEVQGIFTHQATATAVDDTGDPISYTFTASNGVNTSVVGPQVGNIARFNLRNVAGPFEFSVTVDDREECDDAASDATTYFPPRAGGQFHRGDADDNGQLQLTDAIRILGVLFLGQGEITCNDAADADDNGSLQLTDAIRVLGVLFLGQGEVPDPGPPFTGTCGPDPTPDAGGGDLGCASYTHC